MDRLRRELPEPSITTSPGSATLHPRTNGWDCPTSPRPFPAAASKPESANYVRRSEAFRPCETGVCVRRFLQMAPTSAERRASKFLARFHLDSARHEGTIQVGPHFDNGSGGKCLKPKNLKQCPHRK